MRDRLSDETGEETEARLQYMRDRVSDETGEEREARLQQMRTSQRERRSTETADETEARLQQDRESHRERRSTHGLQTRRELGCNMTVRATGKDDLLRRHADETEARLQCDRHRYREQRALGALSQSQLPLIQQHSVQAKMTKFHAHLTTLEVTRCSAHACSTRGQ